ncbi:MAG: hypothetical protein AAGA59_02070 [Actinomycetota bacterium]
MSDVRYPVYHRYAIPARKGLFDSLRGRLSEIPRERSDFAVVLDVEGFYELIPSGVRVESADNIRLANALVLVNIGQKLLEFREKLPCLDNLEERTVVVRFSSRVLDPVAVLGENIGDFSATLATWSRAVLRRASVSVPAGEPEVFHQAALQAMVRELTAAPPIPPFAIDLRVAGLEVDEPKNYVEHGRNRIAKRRAGETRLVASGEDARLEEVHQKRSQTARLNQLAHDEEYYGRSRSLVRSQEDEREARTARRAQLYESAYGRGPEAILALVAADNPEALSDLVAQKLDDRRFLAEMMLKAAKSGLIQSTDLEISLVKAANELLASSTSEPLFAGRRDVATDKGVARGGSGATGDPDFVEPTAAHEKSASEVPDGGAAIASILGSETTRLPNDDRGSENSGA